MWESRGATPCQSCAGRKGKRRKAAGRVRITRAVNRWPNDSHVWAERYDQYE